MGSAGRTRHSRLKTIYECVRKRSKIVEKVKLRGDFRCHILFLRKILNWEGSFGLTERPLKDLKMKSLEQSFVFRCMGSFVTLFCEI